LTFAYEPDQWGVAPPPKRAGGFKGRTRLDMLMDRPGEWASWNYSGQNGASAAASSLQGQAARRGVTVEVATRSHPDTSAVLYARVVES
jgi:hypothetical protein